MSIVVGGLNDYNQVSQNDDPQSITLPLNLNFSFSDISYSVCYQHSVAVGQNNFPYAVGNNVKNQIYQLGYATRKRWYEFYIEKIQNKKYLGKYSVFYHFR